MLSSFINNIEFFSLPDGPDVIIYCNFNQNFYSDSLFAKLGISFTKELQSCAIKRRAEFLAGRYLAKLALEKFGYLDFDLTNGIDRAPIWPQNIQGSISHNNNSAYCAIQRSSTSIGLGIDIETFITLEQSKSMWPFIIHSEELHWIKNHPIAFPQLLTLTFSAKESLYKALYPKVQRYFDFLDAQLIQIDTTNKIFTLKLITPLAPYFKVGDLFHGQFIFKSDTVMTLICHASQAIEPSQTLSFREMT